MNRFFLFRGFLKLALSFTLILTASSVFSQKALQPMDEWAIQVYNQFRIYQGQLDLSNQSHEIVTGRLDDGGSDWVNIEIPAGNTYYILGVCDNDCLDLDLELYSANNEQLSKDNESDDYPLVSVTPTERTVYRVKVVMANCSEAPCRYGVAVYRSE